MSSEGNQIADIFQQKSSKIETARKIQYDQEDVEPTAAEKRDYSDDEIKAMTPDEKALARKKDAMRKRADKLHKINVSILIFLTSFFLSSF